MNDFLYLTANNRSAKGEKIAMKNEKQPAVKISEVSHRRSTKASDTKSVALKNRSNRESMSDVEFVFYETNDPRRERRNTVANQLGPKQTATLKPEVAGAPVRVIRFHFEWQRSGFKVSSSSRVADAGYYYESVKASIEPDDSVESYNYVQKRI